LQGSLLKNGCTDSLYIEYSEKEEKASPKRKKILTERKAKQEKRKPPAPPRGESKPSVFRFLVIGFAQPLFRRGGSYPPQGG
jgi:hypothetical protein